MFNISQCLPNAGGGSQMSLDSLKSRLALTLGLYSKLAQIEWSRVNRVVFVCKGNVCRSPYAEELAAQIGMVTASFGLHTEGGTQANPTAVDCASRRGIDLGTHLSAHIRSASFSKSDLVLFFEPRHILAAGEYLNGQTAQVSLVGLWSAPKQPYIFDPYGRSAEDFDRCFNAIDSAVKTIKTFLPYRERG